MALTKARNRMIGNSPINVLDFMTSAQITDVTSKTGSVDVSAAVQAAINSAETPDSAIYFPQGTYLLNSEVLLVSESRVYGDGIGATTIKAGDGFELSGRLFDTFRRDNITIEGIKFDGNIAGQTGYVPASDNGVSAIIIRSSKNITIRNCYFQEFGKDGVFMFETPPAKTNERINIQDCEFDTIYRNGISVISGEDIVISGNTFFDSNTVALASVTVGDGIRIEPDSSTEYTINCTISNNTFKDQHGGVNVYNENASTIMRNIVITSNVFDNISNAAGVVLNKLDDQGATVSNNRFYDCGSTTADDSITYGGGINCTGSDNVIISGNFFDGCTGKQATIGFDQGGLYSQVVNNVFVNDQRRAIIMQTPPVTASMRGSFRIIQNNTCINGGQETANTYEALRILGNSGEGGTGGSDVIAYNVIDTDTTSGYNGGLVVGYDNGETLIGENIIRGNGTDYSLAGGTSPIYEYEVAQSGSAACTGALTGSVDYQIRRQKDLVTLDFGSLTGTTTNVADITMGVTLPSRFRPSATRYGFCLVQINNAVVNQVGLIQVSTNGTIIIYRDPTQTTWGTAANTGFASATITYVI